MVKKPAMQETQVRCPGLGRSPGEENGNPCQYPCLGSPTDKGTWRAGSPWGCKIVGHDLATKPPQTLTQIQNSLSETPKTRYFIYSITSTPQGESESDKDRPGFAGR